MTGTFIQLGTELGQLVERKNAAYGSSVTSSPAILTALYPNGIGVAQYDDALLIVRIVDKLQRIATDRDALGETPWFDIAGYGLLGTAMHQQQKGSEEPWPGSASAQDAPTSSRAGARRGSAARPASGSTTTSARPSSGAKNSPSPSASSASTSAPASTSPSSAPAPDATASASANAAVLAYARKLSNSDLCADCCRDLGDRAFGHTLVATEGKLETLACCSISCTLNLRERLNL